MLNKEQKKFLRGLSHDKKIMVWVGQSGLSKNVEDEINTALEFHELIKVKMRIGDKATRTTVTAKLCTTLACEKVQMTGHVVTLYRPKEKQPVIKLP